MRKIILTASSYDYSGKQFPTSDRYVIEIDELTGDANIIRVETAAVIERDRSAHLGLGHIAVQLAVEAV